MSQLSISHPYLYDQFAVFGHHAIRWSERHWAGLFSDLIIDQVMMYQSKALVVSLVAETFGKSQESIGL